MASQQRRSRKQFRTPLLGEGLSAAPIVAKRRQAVSPYVPLPEGRAYRGAFLHTGESPAAPVAGGLARRRFVASPQLGPFGGAVRRGKITGPGPDSPALIVRRRQTAWAGDVVVLSHASPRRKRAVGGETPVAGKPAARRKLLLPTLPPVYGLVVRGKTLRTGESPAPPVPGGLAPKRRPFTDTTASLAYPGRAWRRKPLTGAAANTCGCDMLDSMIADDMLMFDRRETVQYERRSLDGVAVQTVTVLALLRAEDVPFSAMGRGGQFTSRGARWHIKAADLSFTPRRGDRIISRRRGTWEVKEVSVGTLSSRFACDCTRLFP